MPDSLAETLASPRWYQALSLSERAALRQATTAAAAAAHSGNDRPPSPNPERAARRLGRWRSQEPFATDGLFERRLACDGLRVGDLHDLLAQSAEDLAATPAPGWLDDLRSAYGGGDPTATIATGAQGAAPFPLAEIVGSSQQGRLLELARPLLDQAYGRLLAGLTALQSECSEPLFEPATAARLFAQGLLTHLLFLLARALTVELQLAAQAAPEGGNGGDSSDCSASSEGSNCGPGSAGSALAGDTPEERYGAFIGRLADPVGALAILQQYPVLARQLAETIGRWAANSLEMAHHLAADAPQLRRLLSPTQPLGLLTELRTGLGDCHRGGRTVSMLQFASGKSLVYKPRSMGVEAAFQDLLDWLNQRGFEPRLRRLAVLDCGEHGWAETVVAAPCAEVAEVDRFYQRQGAYLALLFALSGTDMHSENLIAAGEHPMLVDLEALFHPEEQSWGQITTGTPLPATVLNVGFLPSGDWGAVDGRGGVDLSGLAAVAGQVAGVPVLRLEEAGTDRMRFRHKPIEMPVGEHRPTLGGAEVDLGLYAAAVESGFDRMLHLLARHRDELTAEGGPLDAFASLRVRVLVRLTMAYAGLLGDGQHPFMLGDALDRDRHLDRLWVTAAEYPAFARLIPAEHRDLVRGDVPYFTAHPAGRTVLASDGERLEGLLDDASLDRVKARLRHLDAPEMARQSWIVRNALAGVSGAGRRHEALATEHGGEPHQYDDAGMAPQPGALIEAALAAGRHLESLAFRRGPAAIWFGPDVRGSEQRWVMTACAPDLHLGTAGIALFLAYLGAVAGDRPMTDLARAAVVTLREQSAPGSANLGSLLGAYSGWGGVIYTLTHLGALWGDEALLDDAEAAAAGLEPHIAGDAELDLVGGAAGCLACLLGLWRIRPAAPILDLAVRCGERLLAGAVTAGPGLGWVVEAAGPQPLTGFSHGAAGISWSLLQLAATTGERRFQDAALAGLAYERSLFSNEHRNWPDLRTGGLPGAPGATGASAAAGAAGAPGGDGAMAAEGGAASRRYLTAWCHGAPGIALGRLDSLARVDAATAALLRAEAEVAVQTTLATGFGDNHCLCHGDLGNLEVLTQAAHRLARPDLARQRDRLAAAILADIGARGRRCGLAIQAEAPGLMVGTAGIGYGLLRLAAPDRVPSVLQLAAPTAAG